MKLALEQDVINMLGLQERTGSVSTAQSALELATTQISAHLGTPLERAERVDYFGTGLRNVSDVLGGYEWIMNLTAGFIDSAEPFEVYVSTTGEPINDITDAHAELAEASSYAIDYDRGRLAYFGTLPASRTKVVAVHYTHGYVVDDNDMFQEPHPILCQAAKAQAVINMTSFAGRATDKTPYKDIQSMRRRAVTSLLNNFIRLRATGADVQQTVVIPPP